MPLRPLILCLPFIGILPTPAHAVSFTDQPIACGMGLPYADCRASFDGWTLTISYTNPEGKNSLAVYRQCWGDTTMIHCATGEWRTGTASGPLPGRGIGLRDGKPFPQ